MKRIILFLVFALSACQLSAQFIHKLPIPDNVYINKVVQLDEDSYLAASSNQLYKITLNLGTDIQAELIDTDISEDEYTSIYTDGSIAITTCKKGVYSSSDLDNWIAYKEGIGDKSTVDVAKHKSTLFALTKSSGLYKGGEPWQAVESPWGGSWAYQLLSTDDKLYVATGKGVFVTEDNGTTFTQLNNGLNYTVKSLADGEDYLYAGTSGHGFYTYDFAEEKWKRESDSIGNLDVNAIAKADGRTIIACEPREDGNSLFWCDQRYNWQPYDYGELKSKTIKYVYKFKLDPVVLVSTDQGNYIIDPTVTSIEDQTKSVAIYPNPVTDLLSVAIEENFSGLGDIEIYNSNGIRIKKTENISINSGKVNLSIKDYNLISGIYFCKLTYSSYLHTFSFTVIN